MNFVVPFLVRLFILSGLIAGGYFNVPHVLEASLGVIWTILILTFIFIFFVPDEEIIKNSNMYSKFKVIKHIFLGIITLVLFSLSYYVTGFFFFISWLSHYIKVKNAISSTQNNLEA